MVSKQINVDEISKVARGYFEANTILWTGQVSLLAASGAAVRGHGKTVSR